MSIALKDDDRKYFLDWLETGTQSGILQLKTFDYVAAGNTVILQLANTLDIAGSAFGSPIYLSAYDTDNQTTATASFALSMRFNSTAAANGIGLTAGGTHIVFEQAGSYNIQFSAQIDQTSGSGHRIYIWFAKNGTDIPYSASEVAIQGSAAEAIPSWNFIYDNVSAGDWAEIKWSVDNASVFLKAGATASPVPAIPSTIVTAWKI